MNEFSFVDNVPFSIAAGDSLSLPAGSWDYLYMAELSGGDLLAEGSALRLPFILGRQIRVSKKETGTILLTNRGSTTAVGVIYAGSGDVEDMAMVGTVRVSNLQKAKEQTDSGSQMFGGTRESGASAQYSYCQLFNPSDSLVNVYIQSVVVSVDAAAAAKIGTYDTAMTTETVKGVFNNKDRSAEPKAELRHETDASASVGDQIAQLRTVADTPIGWLGESPVKLGPGQGLIIRSGTTNVDMQVYFEWEEVAV